MSGTIDATIHQGVLRALLAAQAAHPALTARDISNYFERAVLGARVNAAFALEGENLTAALRHELELEPDPAPERGPQRFPNPLGELKPDPVPAPEDWAMIQQALTEAADSRDDWAESNADDPSWRPTAERYRQLAAGPQPGTVLEVEGEARVAFCARRAHALLVLGYDVQDEEDLGSALSDILADLRHLADARDFDFFEADRTARDNYTAERNDV